MTWLSFRLSILIYAKHVYDTEQKYEKIKPIF
jgi:hypothetical protein